MKLMLAQNIRTQRKAHSLTQENLAEAIGVTVGAVSKWENGTTSPDLITLMGLADLFGTSVDALLGYQLGGHTVQSTVEELHTLQQKKEYQAGTAKAENALQRYHNNFAIVRAAANIYYMAGFEQNNAAWLRRALELQEREILLFEQNTDPCISEEVLQCPAGPERKGAGNFEKPQRGRHQRQPDRGYPMQDGPPGGSHDLCGAHGVPLRFGPDDGHGPGD